MNLVELIRRFRVLAHDSVTAVGSDGDDLLWSDQDITDWFNDAEIEACVRGRLLREDALPAMCQINLVPGQHTYPLHPKLYEIINLRLRSATDTRSRPIFLKSREWLDENRPDWRDDTNPPRFAVQNETSLRIVGGITAGDVLLLEAYRLPLQDLALPDPQNPSAPVHDTPEIHEASHKHLIDWVLHKAFSIPDTEAFDKERSADAEEAFTAHFGLPVTSDFRRSTRSDVEHHTKVYLP